MQIFVFNQGAAETVYICLVPTVPLRVRCSHQKPKQFMKYFILHSALVLLVIELHPTW